jgi:hypothetical protein
VTLTRFTDSVRCDSLSQTGSNSAGEHTKMLKARARDVATLSRFKLYKKFIPRGESACVEVVMEQMAISCPWNLYSTYGRTVRSRCASLSCSAGGSAATASLRIPASLADPPGRPVQAFATVLLTRVASFPGMRLTRSTLARHRRVKGVTSTRLPDSPLQRLRFRGIYTDAGALAPPSFAHCASAA